MVLWSPISSRLAAERLILEQIEGENPKALRTPIDVLDTGGALLLSKQFTKGGRRRGLLNSHRNIHVPSTEAQYLFARLKVGISS